jgi:hypothetical protein
LKPDAASRENGSFSKVSVWDRDKMYMFLKTQKRIRYVMYLTLSVLILSMGTADSAKAAATAGCVSAAENGIGLRSVLKFAAGITTAFMIHEGAHAAVAELSGTELDWEIGNVNQPMAFTEYASSDDKGLAINSAGLISQAVGSEIILHSETIDKNDAFVRGMMIWNILNPISYAIDYWFIHRTNKKKGNTYKGDIQGIEYYGNESTADAFALSMAGIAIFQGYRFLRTQPWAPDWLKAESHGLNIQPLYSGGVMLTYRFDF